MVGGDFESSNESGAQNWRSWDFILSAAENHRSAVNISCTAVALDVVEFEATLACRKVAWEVRGGERGEEWCRRITSGETEAHPGRGSVLRWWRGCLVWSLDVVGRGTGGSIPPRPIPTHPLPSLPISYHSIPCRMPNGLRPMLHTPPLRSPSDIIPSTSSPNHTSPSPDRIHLSLPRDLPLSPNRIYLSPHRIWIYLSLLLPHSKRTWNT